MRFRHAAALVLLLLAAVLRAAPAVARRGERRTCADRGAVEAALGAAEVEAAHSLARAEAGWLVGGLRLRGSPGPRGTLCFSRADFATFGHILATVLAAPAPARSSSSSPSSPSLAPTSARFTTFERPNGADAAPPPFAPRCECRCAAPREAWCGGGSPRCCALYCRSIFSAISVGALAALVRDGVAACCRDASQQCDSPPPPLVIASADDAPLRSAPPAVPSARPTPPENAEFRFRAPGSIGGSGGADDGAAEPPAHAAGEMRGEGSAPASPPPTRPSHSTTPTPEPTVVPAAGVDGARAALGMLQGTAQGTAQGMVQLARASPSGHAVVTMPTTMPTTVPATLSQPSTSTTSSA